MFPEFFFMILISPDSVRTQAQILFVHQRWPRERLRFAGGWPALPGASPAELELDRFVATGDVKLPQGKPGAGPRKALIQTAHVDRSGTLHYSRPRPYPLQDGKFVAGRKIEEGRSLYTKGRRRRWLHRKPFRPFGYRLLNEAVGRHTVCFNT